MTSKFIQYRLLLILLATVAACILLSLSWPRLRASVHFLPVDTAISNYWKTREVNHTQLDGLVNRAAESITIHDHYRYWEGQSELLILTGQDMNRSFWERREALEKSIVTAQEVVRRAPARPRAWLRIARAGEFLSYPAAQVIPAFKMSIMTGRVEPTLMLSRLELGLRYLPAMDADATRLLRDQAILTWTGQQRAMLKRIESGHLSADLLRELLATSAPSILSEMEVHLVK
jgi:hypothetical protein